MDTYLISLVSISIVTFNSETFILIIIITRSYAALRAADLDWIAVLDTVLAGRFWKKKT